MLELKQWVKMNNNVIICIIIYTLEKLMISVCCFKPLLDPGLLWFHLDNLNHIKQEGQILLLFSWHLFCSLLQHILIFSIKKKHKIKL